MELKKWYVKTPSFESFKSLYKIKDVNSAQLVKINHNKYTVINPLETGNILLCGGGYEPVICITMPVALRKHLLKIS